MFFMMSADFFPKLTLTKKIVNKIGVSNGLDSDQARHSGSKLFAKGSAE